MNVFKKTLGCLVATVLGVSISIPAAFTANAEDNCSELRYHPCDVNHDGAVTIIDVICLNQYLTGLDSTLPPAVSKYDANLDKVVNAADTLCVLCEIVGDDYSSSYIDITSQYNLNLYTGSKDAMTSEYEWMKEWGLNIDDLEASSSTEPDLLISSSVQYYKYICSNSTLSTYTLTNASSTTLNDTAQLDSEAVDVGDYINRNMNVSSQVNGAGLDGVVKLTCTSSSNFISTNRGTGFIVGDHVIACAAHSVFVDSTHNHNMIGASNFAPNLKVTLYNTDGTPKTTQLTVKQIHIPYDLIPVYQTKYDYALITVSEDLSSYTHYNLGTPVLPATATLTSIDIFMFGFPGTDDVRVSQGHIVASGSTDSVLRDNCPSAGGFSGGPVFAVCDYSIDDGASVQTTRIYSALSIHTKPGIGPHFNYRLLRFYCGNQANIGY